MKKLFLLLSLFTFILTSNAQDCSNDFLDGDELNTDCGGEFCPTCLPLWYQVNCDEVAGSFQVEIQLPTYLWNPAFFEDQLFYEYVGDLSKECFDLFECWGVIAVPDADIVVIQLQLSQFGTENIFGQGKISAQAACVKLDEIENDCPPDANFNVTATPEWADSTLYMIKMEMEGGTPPYKISDNDAGLFYHTQWENDVYYLGAIPDSVELNVSVFDINGCRFDFPVLQRPVEDFGEMVEDTMSSIEKIVLANDLFIYPTIFDHQITLDLLQNKPGKLTVYSIEGQQVAQWDVNGQKESFATSHLANGTYIFAFETEDEILTKIAVKE